MWAVFPPQAAAVRFIYSFSFSAVSAQKVSAIVFILLFSNPTIPAVSCGDVNNRKSPQKAKDVFFFLAESSRDPHPSPELTALSG